ncbi:MAG TPA: ABC transporter permease, partial [Verrucomicrobiae bacterium]|nr:ABC transporter permease [Verrucomicrobiae bacterium]
MRSLTGGHFKAGFDAIRSAKLRNFWTMLGVIIGVTSVITIVGIGEGVKAQVSGQIHHLGKDLITVHPAQLRSGGANGTAVNELVDLNVASSLTNKDVDTVAGTKNVGSSAPLTFVTGTLSGDSGAYKSGIVIGTTPDLPSLLNQSMAYGVFLSDNDIGTNAAVLGSHAAEALFNEDVPLGRSFTFRGQQFIVRGIFNDFDSTPLSQEADFNSAVFIPYDVGESLTNNTAPIYEILAKPDNSHQTTAVAASVQRALDKSHGGQSNL